MVEKTEKSRTRVNVEIACAQCQPVEKGNSRLVAAAVSAAASFRNCRDPASTGKRNDIDFALAEAQRGFNPSVKARRFSSLDDDAGPG